MKNIINILLAPIRIMLLLSFLPIGFLMLFAGLDDKAFNIMDKIQTLWILR